MLMIKQLIAKPNFWTDVVLMLSRDRTGMQIKTKITQLTLPNCWNKQIGATILPVFLPKTATKNVSKRKITLQSFLCVPEFLQLVEIFIEYEDFIGAHSRGSHWSWFGSQQPPLLVALLPPDLLHHNHGDHRACTISWLAFRRLITPPSLSHWLKYVTY